MGAHNSSLPIFRADMFEFGELEVPRHSNRLPTPNERGGESWAIRGILSPDLREPRILATSIQDEDIMHMLVLARYRRLSVEHPSIEKFDGHEVEMLLPMEAKRRDYTIGNLVNIEIVKALDDGATSVDLIKAAEALSGGADPSIIGQIARRGTGVEPVAAAA